jgi:hypothetical protein
MFGRMTRSMSKCAGRVGVEEGDKPKMVIFCGPVYTYSLQACRLVLCLKESSESQISPESFVRPNCLAPPTKLIILSYQECPLLNSNLRSENTRLVVHMSSARRASVKKIQYIPNHSPNYFLVRTEIPRHSLANVCKFLIRYHLYDVQLATLA